MLEDRASETVLEFLSAKESIALGKRAGLKFAVLIAEATICEKSTKGEVI